MAQTRIPALLYAAMILITAAPASPAVPQDCQCPSGYDPTIQCTTFCAAEPVKKEPCPDGATYDDNLGLCAADPDNDGQCPKGMTRPLYRQKCTSKKRTNEYACPPGGHFDKDKGYCTAPCMINSDSQTNGVQCTTVQEATHKHTR